MDMNGEFVIAADRQAVWNALNDPYTLKACLPGCEVLDKVSDTQFTATMRAAVGPVKAKFTSNLTLEDLDPPYSYTISGQGKGGSAGFAKGAAKVRLEPCDEGTQLIYEVNMQVGGKLAQIGSRLIGGTARKIADQFFSRFAEIMSTS
ncbi:MAG: carbon monoxide dehydrogenase [Gammaproteobacteria bacterium]|nr:carbon monoxide dehydrogenase [Gammaproteobacteria bacterium]